MPEEHTPKSGFVSRLGGVLRWPSIRFLLLGAILFAADSLWNSLGASAGRDSRRIILTQTDVAQLRRSFELQYGRSPNPPEERSLVDPEIDDELLYQRALELGLDRGNRVVRERLVAVMRLITDDPTQDDDALFREALSLGLDQTDRVVRRHLVEMMALLLRRPGETRPIAEEDLRQLLEREAAQFRVPQELTLTHVYFDPARRGATTESEAIRLLEELRGGRPSRDEAPSRGDPFLLGSRFVNRSARKLRTALGNNFTDTVTDAAVGRWIGPIRSSYGLHLVIVEARRSERLPSVDEIRDQLVGRLREERGEEALRNALSEMRATYVVNIEPAQTGSSTTIEGTVLSVPRPRGTRR